MTDESVDEREIEAAEAALVEAKGFEYLRDAAKHVVVALRPSMWLTLQRKVDGLEAQVERLLKLLHPSSQ